MPHKCRSTGGDIGPVCVYLWGVGVEAGGLGSCRGVVFLFHLSLSTPEAILQKSLSEFYNPLNINLALTQHATFKRLRRFPV